MAQEKQSVASITIEEVQADAAAMTAIAELAEQHESTVEYVLEDVMEILTERVGVSIETALSVVKNDILQDFAPELASEYHFGSGTTDADRALRLRLHLENLSKPQDQAAALVNGVRPYYENLYIDEKINGSTTPLVKSFFAGGYWPPSDKETKTGATKHMSISDIKDALNPDESSKTRAGALPYRPELEKFRATMELINRCSYHFSTISKERKAEQDQKDRDKLESDLVDGSAEERAAAKKAISEAATAKHLGTVNRAAKTLKSAIADRDGVNDLDRAAFMKELTQGKTREVIAELVQVLATVLPIGKMIEGVTLETVIRKGEHN